MRLAAVLLAAATLAACAPAGPARPAWPTRAERPADGGESIDPRAAARAIAAVEADRPAESADAEPAAAAAASFDDDDDAEDDGAPGVTVTEEPLTLEEVLIEIDGKGD